VEVLAAGSGEGERWYRVEGQSGRHTPAEVKDILREQREKSPPIKKLVIVVYRDSPDRSAYPVRRLEELANELGLTPVIELPDRNAPP
jgi:hypothetical protein